MDSYRFYVPNLPLEGVRQTEVEFPETEAHHARSVLRLEKDEPVVLFNGAGAWCAALLTRVDKRGVWAGLLDTPQVDPPLSPALTLATALPKGERAEWLVEQASQLGVAALQFLECERAVVKLREGGHKIEKWRRLAVESAKQCGRTHLLQIDEALELGNLRRQAQASRILWLDPGPGGVTVHAPLADWPGAVLALVGPEGGWSPAEKRLLQDAVDAGWVRRVRLTQTVLRIETACAALASLVMCR